MKHLREEPLLCPEGDGGTSFSLLFSSWLPLLHAPTIRLCFARDPWNGITWARMWAQNHELNWTLCLNKLSYFMIVIEKLLVHPWRKRLIGDTNWLLYRPDESSCCSPWDWSWPSQCTREVPTTDIRCITSHNNQPWHPTTEQWQGKCAIDTK